MSRGIYDMNKVIEWFYNFLWGDLFTLHFGDVSIGIPLLVLLLIPAGIFFTIRTKIYARAKISADDKGSQR